MVFGRPVSIIMISLSVIQLSVMSLKICQLYRSSRRIVVDLFVIWVSELQAKQLRPTNEEDYTMVL